MSIDIKQPNNSADTVINLTISGNRLVSILNACQGMMGALEHVRYEASGQEFASSWYAELWDTVERCRDQLSEQRCAVHMARMGN